MPDQDTKAIGFRLNVVGNVWLDDSFWAEPQTEPPTCEFELDEIKQVMDMRYSTYVEIMRTMDAEQLARASRLLKYVSETDFTTRHTLTGEEVLYPNYLVRNSADPNFKPYALGREPMLRGGFQVFDLAQVGGEDYMDQLRLRGFAYVDF
jgi:hypothetical protein